MNKYFFIFVLLFSPALAFGEEDIEDILDEITSDEIIYESATFKSTRIINGHSVERMREGELDFRVSHRFDRLNKGLYDLFGLDESNTLFSLEYGITDWAMIGFGRTTYHKTYNAFIKFPAIRQSSGAVTMPISLSIFGSAAANSLKKLESDPGYSLKSRMEYTGQFLFARKFSKYFSAQISPTFMHRNLVIEGDDNDIYSIGFGARMKLSNWVSINAEYFYVHNKDTHKGNKYYDPISLGIDIETGGHVFQLVFSNSISMMENGFIAQTTGNWFDGDIHFGFNISRVFSLY